MRNQMMIFVFAGAALQLSPSAAMSAPGSDEAAKKDRPSRVELIDGSKVKRVTLTEKAAQRLDIRTGEVSTEGSGRLTTPYSSVVYDTGGGTWVFTMPKPLTYVRHSVLVEAIKGEKAYLKHGPPAGTMVVTVGVAELYGAEKGVGH
jgi:hypothetical protein